MTFRNHLRAIVGLLLASSLIPSLLVAAGFDCAKATAPMEKRICADPEVSDLDGRLAEAFRQALAASVDKPALRAAQRAWIKTRDACPDAACLRLAYADRLAQLQSATAAASAKTAPAPSRSLSRQAWYDRLKWPKDCEEEYQERPSKDDPGVEVHALEGTTRLAIVGCGLFAYQESAVVMLFDEGHSAPGRLLTFTEYDRDTSGKVERSSTTEPAGLLTFNDADKTLTIFSKGRGVGDCGSYTVYGFDAGQVVVRSARAQPCYDNEKKWIKNPAHWPLVPKP